MISNTFSVVEAAVPVTIVPVMVSLPEVPVIVSTLEVSVLVKYTQTPFNIWVKIHQTNFHLHNIY